MLVERTFDSGTVSVNCAEVRDAGPPRLMLHGVTSRWQNFLRFVAQRDLARAGLSLAELTARLVAMTPGGDAVTTRSRAASLSQMDPEVLTPIVEDRAIDDYDAL